MPKLNNPERRQTKRIILPSSTKEDEAWVDIYEEAVAGDLEQVGDVHNLKGHATMVAITNIIKAWNFEDENGRVAEINIENVRRLRRDDISKLLDEIKAYDEVKPMTDEEKKSSLIDSSPRSDAKSQTTPKA
jgi:hypothetical protein